MKGQRAPTAIGRVEIATPSFPESGQRAEIAKVENSSPKGRPRDCIARSSICLRKG